MKFSLCLMFNGMSYAYKPQLIEGLKFGLRRLLRFCDPWSTIVDVRNV